MKKENVLATEPVPKLLFKFALPSVIAMIVGAFYNIVDQIYIGNSIGVVGPMQARPSLGRTGRQSIPCMRFCLAALQILS